MIITQQDAWDRFVAHCGTERLSRQIYEYAMRWADAMETAQPRTCVDLGLSDEAIKKLSEDTDTDYLSGSAWGFALRGLCASWRWGDELWAWYKRDLLASLEKARSEPPYLPMEYYLERRGYIEAMSLDGWR